MTTNHIEKIDPAILRPGRTDLCVSFNFASTTQLYTYFLNFFPGQVDLAQKFLMTVPANKFPLSAIQQHFLLHQDDP